MTREKRYLQTIAPNVAQAHLIGLIIREAKVAWHFERLKNCILPITNTCHRRVSQIKVFQIIKAIHNKFVYVISTSTAGTNHQTIEPLVDFWG